MDCGGVTYWMILLIKIPWVAVFVVFTSHYLHKVYLRKSAVNYQFVEGDIQWSKKTVVYFPLGCAVAGTVAGMFGVGVGITTGSIMMELGIVPGVATSTMVMILYSSGQIRMIAWHWAALAFVVPSASQRLCIRASVPIRTLLMTYQAIKIISIFTLPQAFAARTGKLCRLNQTNPDNTIEVHVLACNRYLF
ncbi:hypothetical protein PHYPSEUDO_000066 [Phytophthora pseudosyringae]|uniref:Uncharacterized protein n=1 Tax=Phytophthora pseudosyringae TaxID=221518 RepID=A0A8T1WQ96_9STRA|nr:hypothetical protein PHYPSEUDO_000066 [Phytophthora pseudosyringae]